MIGRAGIAWIVALGVATSAAQAHGGDDVDAAREHYQKGKRAYDVGHFAEAAKEYELAYKAKDDPVLLYDLGQAHRLAAHRAEALFAYRAYLRNAPGAPNRAEVETRIHDLEATPPRQLIPATQEPDAPALPSTAAGKRAPELLPPSPNSTRLQSTVTASPLPPRRPVYKKWWFWTAAGAVVAAAAIATAVGITQGQPHEASFQVHSP